MNQQEVKESPIVTPKNVDQSRAEQIEAERKRLREERRALMVDHDSQCI
jgi:hypothetical protein